LIGFEKMPQEGDSLNGISGRDCHDVPTFCVLFPSLCGGSRGSAGSWQSLFHTERNIHIIHQKQNPLRVSEAGCILEPCKNQAAG
jgi:hypothetical protein